MNQRPSPAPISGEIYVPVDVEEFEPTNAQLSAQLGALSAQVTGCHAAAQRAHSASETAVGLMAQLSADVRQIRKTQLEDHAPRLTEVEREQKQQRGSLMPVAKATGKYSAIVLAWPLLEQLWDLVKPLVLK